VLAQAGAAAMLIEADLTPEKLESDLKRLLRDPLALELMSVTAKGLAHADATKKITEMAVAIQAEKRFV
jgi:UDP-N-acetylglucosamine:LPS N-acetylglucosamine transferase